jgi:hypothetical protein
VGRCLEGDGLREVQPETVRKLILHGTGGGNGAGESRTVSSTRRNDGMHVMSYMMASVLFPTMSARIFWKGGFWGQKPVTTKKNKWARALPMRAHTDAPLMGPHASMGSAPAGDQ